MNAKPLFAQYDFPLGCNHARLLLFGEKLTLEDADALIEIAQLFRKQIERAAGNKPPSPESTNC